ncbi:hypothetical protein ACE38V_16205 [Cytobacillus sp. Hz8]|uniref:hypothetical protein n=1 Tax=Cytobacillus sp. Hz8 TaxID=3347168 RepID=UPI0035E0BAE1
MTLGASLLAGCENGDDKKASDGKTFFATLRNSAFITISVVILTLLTNSMAAFRDCKE